jgi:hypothetical protein
VEGHQRQFLVQLNQQTIKRLAIKGLHNQIMPFQDYLQLIRQEALSEWRSWRYGRTPRYG